MKHTMKIMGVVIILLLFGGSLFCTAERTVQQMILTSPAFAAGQELPEQYACEVAITPPLSWSRLSTWSWTGGLKLVRSYVLVCEDYDSGFGKKVHWIVYNIPPYTTSVPEDFGKSGKLSLGDGVKQALNGENQFGYTGVCTEEDDVPHRFYFKVYALDTILGFKDESSVTTQMIIEKVEKHLVGYGELMTTYAKAIKCCPF